MNVNVFARGHRPQGHGGVVVVRRGDDDGVDFLRHVVEQFAVVEVLFRVRPRLGPFAQPGIVDVTQANDVHVLSGLLDVTRAFAADSDAGDANAIRGIAGIDDGGRGAGEEIAEGPGGGNFQGLTTGKAGWHGRSGKRSGGTGSVTDGRKVSNASTGERPV